MLLLLSKIAWYLNGRPLLFGEQSDGLVLHSVIVYSNFIITFALVNNIKEVE